MTGIQISAAWAVVQAAESLATSDAEEEREAGRSLRCCEIVALERVDGTRRKRHTQGVQISLRFYREDDLAAVESCCEEVEVRVSQAFGLWVGAVQISVDLMESDEPWLGISRRSTRGGTGLRLDRYFTDAVLDRLEERGGSDWGYLVEHEAEVRILLRRLRYKLGQDYGANGTKRSYAFWTSETTRRWAMHRPHHLEYLVHKLSLHSEDLTSANADPASSLDIGYWGEVDTETDPLRIFEVTTKGGTTDKDVQSVFNHAGSQIEVVSRAFARGTQETNKFDPLLPFINQLRSVKRRPALLDSDVLFVHRGGGVNPHPDRPEWGHTNVADARRRELLDLCLDIRDLGIEVVVALGHANISVLDWEDRSEEVLPMGIFEATTPTAGAAWILQEHVNPRLVDRSIIYSQHLAT